MPPELAALGIDNFDDEERLMLVTALWDWLKAKPADCPEIMKYVGADKLTIDERIELAFATWNSIPHDSPTLKPTPEQLQELERRVAEHDADPSTGIPW